LCGCGERLPSRTLTTPDGAEFKVQVLTQSPQFYTAAVLGPAGRTAYDYQAMAEQAYSEIGRQVDATFYVYSDATAYQYNLNEKPTKEEAKYMLQNMQGRLSVRGGSRQWMGPPPLRGL